MLPLLPARAAVPEEDGAPPSFELLYAVARSHLPEALRLSRVPPDDIEDIVQDAVLIAYQGLPRFAPRAEGTRRSLRAWLSAIAWRLASRRRGRAYRRFELHLPQGDPSDLAGASEGSPTTEQLAAAEQRRKILASVVHALRPERAEVLLMHAFLEMSVPDIAEELGLNPNTVKSRIARARADALAAVRRLSRDEQNALEGNLALLPPVAVYDGGLTRSYGALQPPKPPGDDGGRERSALWWRAVRSASLAAGMLALGFVLGAVLREPERRAAEDAPIVAAVDHVGTADTGAMERAIAVPALVPAPRAALPAPESQAGAASSAESRSLERERAWLTAARRAIQERAGARAREALTAHEREFPRGVLARERELLAAQARALAGGR
jgi:RNA polymerase sigma-70 factor (ECF subfamily)